MPRGQRHDHIAFKHRQRFHAGAKGGGLRDQRQIDPSFRQRGNHGVTGHLVNFHLHMRVGDAKRHETRRHDGKGKIPDRADRQFAKPSSRRLAHRMDRLIGLLERAARAAQKNPAHLRQAHATPISIEKIVAHLGLQIPDLPA